MPHTAPHTSLAYPHNRPAPIASLGLEHQPTSTHFRREHFPAPAIDPDAWRLRIGGLVRAPVLLSLDRLRGMEQRTLAVVLECAGHRRSELEPRVRGLGWEAGAVSEAVWTGAPLARLLALAGVVPEAVEVMLEGTDTGASEHGPNHRFARSLPLAKALHPDTLLAYELNGAPIPAAHGGPVRVIVPGWYATDSVKWLNRVRVLDTAFDGPFQARDYRLLEPGETGPGRRMERLRVHALITAPEPSAAVPAGRTRIAGIAWGGCPPIARVEVRVDDGPWADARTGIVTGRYGRTFWEAWFDAVPGDRLLQVRATDAAGETQPDAPRWNQGGYMNNAVHRVAVTVRGG